MKKTVLISVQTLALTAGVSAQSWATKWDWPLQPIHQQYNVGEDAASDMDVGGAGIYWQLINQIDSPYVRDALLADRAKKRTASADGDKPAATAPKS